MNDNQNRRIPTFDLQDAIGAGALIAIILVVAWYAVVTPLRIALALFDRGGHQSASENLRDLGVYLIMLTVSCVSVASIIRQLRSERDSTTIANEKEPEYVVNTKNDRETNGIGKQLTAQVERRPVTQIEGPNKTSQTIPLTVPEVREPRLSEVDALRNKADEWVVQHQQSMREVQEHDEDSRYRENQRWSEDHIQRTQRFIDSLPPLPQHPSEGMYDYAGATRRFIEDRPGSEPVPRIGQSRDSVHRATDKSGIKKSPAALKAPAKKLAKASPCGPSGCPAPPGKSVPAPATPKKQLPTKADTYSPDRVMRTWTSSDGKFSTYAELLRVDASSVILLTDAGREVRVPISRLCKEDQSYVKGLSKLGTKVANKQ